MSWLGIMIEHVAYIKTGFVGAVAAAGASLGIVASTVPAAGAAPQGTVATVNGVPVTRSALDAALAAAQRSGTAAEQREFKQRLIACELLRQAARQAQRRPPGQGFAAQPGGMPACSTPEIRSYVMHGVRPAAVTEAQVRARCSALARAHALPPSGAGQAPAAFAQVAASLRRQMEAERLDDAIRLFADRLLTDAKIEQ